MTGHDLATPDGMHSDEPHPLEPARPDDPPEALDAWRANVGEPVSFDARLEADPALDAVDVLCWNIAIGAGRLDLVLDRLTTADFVVPGTGIRRIAPSARRPLVILLQEAFRSDASVPAAASSVHHGGRSPLARHQARYPVADIVELARTLGLSLRYVPSMRNGQHPSDRGNAVLSNVRLSGAQSFLLPLVRQRRVGVAARLGGHTSLCFVSAHLDTHGPPPGGARLRRFGSGRTAQAVALAERTRTLARSPAEGEAPPAQRRAGIVLGADLNSVLGMTDPAVRVLARSGLRPARRIGSWRHTFHTPVRMLVDHVMFEPGTRITGIDVIRLDEAARDRSPRVFGSDHHPLLAHVHLSAKSSS